MRLVAVDVLTSRWKTGMDTSGAQTAILWCAANGATDLKVKCLGTLGDKGNAKAGPGLDAATKDADAKVKSAAEAACKNWMKRFPKGVPGATGACKGSA